MTVSCFSIFGYKAYNQSDFSVGRLVMTMCRVFFCFIGRGCLLWPVHSLGETLLAFALLHYVLQGQIWPKNVGLKVNIQKTKIMASNLITSCQINGETVKTVADFIFGDSNITEDGDCSHEIKRRLLLGRKFMTNLDSILKSGDITLPA